MGKFNFLFLIICFNTILTACGDLQKPSATSKCDDAINSQNWDNAISNCSTSRSKGDAYMGKAGFTVANLINNSSGEVRPDHIKNAHNNLSGVDSTGAKIMKILGFAYSDVNSKETRNTKLVASKKNLDLAKQQYGQVMNSDKDAALMYTYANIFALQLNQVSLYDNISYACHLTNTCTGSHKYLDSDSDYKALENLDGYYYVQETRAKELTYLVGSKLNLTQYCADLGSTITYISDAATGLTKIGVSSTSGNTEVITDILKTTCTLIKGLYDQCDSNGNNPTNCKKTTACNIKAKCESSSKPIYDYWAD